MSFYKIAWLIGIYIDSFFRFSRRKERALNVETFGVMSRNYRGRPYRGRGGRGRGRGRGFGRGGQQSRRGGRGGNRTWVDYEFDFEAAGIRQGGKSNKSGGKIPAWIPFLWSFFSSR